MSNTSRKETTPQAAETTKTGRDALLLDIGTKLAAARTARGEALDQPVRVLKLRKRHLQALESGNWDDMPDDVYVLGFLRQYCQYLKLDLSDDILRLKNDQYALTKPMTFPDPPVAPSRPWAWIFGGAFVVLFIIFNIVSHSGLFNHDDSAHIQATHAPAPSQSLAAKKIPTDTSMQASPPLASNTRPVTAAVHSVANNAEQTPAVKQHRPAKKVAPVSPSHTAATTAIATIKPAGNIHYFRFKAVGSPVWLQIFIPNRQGTGRGRLVKEVLLKPGHHLGMRRSTESLWITCGNAPALRISVDRKIVAAAGTLGAGRKVLRDYRFDIPAP